jgi:predicted nucleic acid-binding protein
LRLFLDSSVLLAASGSARGASREVFRLAASQGWSLIATPYVVEEVLINLPDLIPSASAEWARLRQALILLDDVLTLDRPAVFSPAKDRPILFSALAWADVLLTLDRGDFAALLGQTFYDLAVLKPGDFLQRERAAGRLSHEAPETGQ